MSPRIVPSALPVFALVCALAPARADFASEWTSNVPVGNPTSSALAGVVVDPSGVSYVASNAATGNGDVLTAAIGPDGTLLWSRTWNGPTNGAEQARGIALGPGGTLYVSGSTPGAGNFANVLVLAYDTATGALLGSRVYSSGPSRSEAGEFVAVDPSGGVYVCGSTTGDGSDAHVLKFDAALAFQWRRTWDGPAFGSFSQDFARMIRIDPNGDPVVLVQGITTAQQPDYYVFRFSALDGSTLLQSNWGTNGAESASDMELDASGDIYVTGTGVDVVDKYCTVKFSGLDGHVVWQAYDFAPLRRNFATGLALDGHGGVYVTGGYDPDGDTSNANGNQLTVKRDASSGALIWTHLYGQNCVGCYDAGVDVLVDDAGHVFVASLSSSPPYANDALTFVLDAGTGVETTRGVLATPAPWVAKPGSLRFDADQNVFDAGEIYDAGTNSVAVSVVKYPSRLALAGTSFCSGDLGSGDHTSVCPCGNVGAPGRGCAHSFDPSGAQLDASGRSADDSVVLRARFLPATSFTMFLQHAAGGDVTFHDGVLCASGSLVRLRGRAATAGSAFFPNSAHAAVDSLTLAQRGGVAVGSGTQRFYSAWFRNVSTTFCPPATSNVTNGWRITW